MKVSQCALGLTYGNLHMGLPRNIPPPVELYKQPGRKLLARRSHRVNFVQINTGILACSREGGCDRPKDNKSTNVQVSNTKNVFKGACGVCTKGENSISPKEQEMTRRQSNQKKCIADQKWWSQSTFFDLQKNPYLPHNLKALDKGHVSRFSFLFECKHLKDAVSLWTGRRCRHKRKSFFPKHHTKIHSFFSSTISKKILCPQFEDKRKHSCNSRATRLLTK